MFVSRGLRTSLLLSAIMCFSVVAHADDSEIQQVSSSQNDSTYQGWAKAPSGHKGLAQAHTLVFDSMGRAIMAWQDDPNGLMQIYVMRFENGAWRALGPEADNKNGISNTKTASHRPKLAVDRHGRIIASWLTFRAAGKWSLRAKRFDSQVWHDLAPSGSTNLDVNYTPDVLDHWLSFDATGHVVATWIAKTLDGSMRTHSRRFEGGKWVTMHSKTQTIADFAPQKVTRQTDGKSNAKSNVKSNVKSRRPTAKNKTCVGTAVPCNTIYAELH